MDTDRQNRENLLETIRASVIGADNAIDSPFGLRRVTYADYTASGRSLEFIEDFIRHDTASGLRIGRAGRDRVDPNLSRPQFSC